jgi:chaperone required for assembly of F1-ATPase
MNATAEKKPLPIFTMIEVEDGFTIYRDAVPLETPRNLAVTVPTKALGEALLQECRAQGERLDLRTMPLTQMTLTALDITSRQRSEIISGIVRYGESELLCQRANEPADLVAAQDIAWTPYLDWCRDSLKADLCLGSGVVPFEQSAEALAALRDVVATFEAFPLTGVSEAVGVSGSLVLGLALVKGHATADEVFAAAELDALWQAKKWGDDPATEGRHAEIKRDLDVCARWFALLG